MDNLNKHPFQGLIPSSILRSPSILGKRQMRGRHSHAIIIKLQGTTEYRTENKQWLLSPGQILFVEKGSHYFIREVTPGYSYVVNFDCPGEFHAPVFKLPLPPDYDLEPTAERMYNAWQKENLYSVLSTLYSLLHISETALIRGYISPREKQLLDPVMAYLKVHLTDPDLALDALPRLAGVSDAYLRRIFKKQYSISPAGYVIRERIRLAKDFLLRIDGIRIAEVAEKVGYHDPLYFSRLFKKQTGLSPSEYCKIHIENLF